MCKPHLFGAIIILCFGSALGNPMRPDPISAPTVTKSVAPAVVKQTYRWPTLDNIIIIGDLRKAIFNRSSEVKLGETITGYQLVQVEKDYVILQRGTTTKRINLTTIGAISITPTVEE